MNQETTNILKGINLILKYSPKAAFYFECHGYFEGNSIHFGSCEKEDMIPEDLELLKSWGWKSWCYGVTYWYFPHKTDKAAYEISKEEYQILPNKRIDNSDIEPKNSRY